MRPVFEFLSLDEEDRLEYLQHWEREARSSDNWKLQRNRSMELSKPFEMEQLLRIERRLAKAEIVAVHGTSRWPACARRPPPGWRGPDDARRGPQPLPPGAVKGKAASEALDAFIDLYTQDS